jgi:hypothetical protein
VACNHFNGFQIPTLSRRRGETRRTRRSEETIEMVTAFIPVPLNPNLKVGETEKVSFTLFRAEMRNRICVYKKLVNSQSFLDEF